VVAHLAGLRDGAGRPLVTCCTFDNRGIGLSAIPSAAAQYSTRLMAHDVLGARAVCGISRHSARLRCFDGTPTSVLLRGRYLDRAMARGACSPGDLGGYSRRCEAEGEKFCWKLTRAFSAGLMDHLQWRRAHLVGLSLGGAGPYL